MGRCLLRWARIGLRLRSVIRKRREASFHRLNRKKGSMSKDGAIIVKSKWFRNKDMKRISWNFQRFGINLLSKILSNSWMGFHLNCLTYLYRVFEVSPETEADEQTPLDSFSFSQEKSQLFRKESLSSFAERIETINTEEFKDLPSETIDSLLHLQDLLSQKLNTLKWTLSEP